jgi:hypothetical protein
MIIITQNQKPGDMQMTHIVLPFSYLYPILHYPLDQFTDRLLQYQNNSASSNVANLKPQLTTATLQQPEWKAWKMWK